MENPSVESIDLLEHVLPLGLALLALLFALSKVAFAAALLPKGLPHVATSTSFFRHFYLSSPSLSYFIFIL